MIMKKPGPLCRRLAGLTLIELLAVVAIIGLLMALLLPSLQGAREAARRLQCGNHLKQMAGGIFSHDSALGYFPDGGDKYWAKRTWIGQGSAGSPAMAPQQGWGWSYQILPYIEMQSLWVMNLENPLRATTIGLYTCPTRRGPMNTRPTPAWPHVMSGLATIDYAGNGGTDHGYEIYWKGNPNWWHWKDALSPRFTLCQNPFVSGWNAGEDFCPDWGMPGAGRDAPIIRQPTGSKARNGSPLTSVKIRDGASNTMLLGEKCLNVGLLGITQTDDDSGWTDGWDWDVIRWGFVPPMQDFSDPDPSMAHKGYTTFHQAFGSSHPGGFMIVLCDGSVRSVSYTVAHDVFMRLSSRDDAQPLNLDDL
jgi:prepilin-type N-terminal cleavage/methylation domain-containing protein